jgi:hypothetical protein
MMIDTAWFQKQLEARGQSVRGLARYMKLDPSAVSRMLNGARKMSAEEQDRISEFLSINLEEIALRRRGGSGGFGERGQSVYAAENTPANPELPTTKMFTENDIIYKDGKRWMEGRDGKLVEVHPAFGCMKGTITVMPGVDLTEPMDFEWSGELYNE